MITMITTTTITPSPFPLLFTRPFAWAHTLGPMPAGQAMHFPLFPASTRRVRT